MKFVIKGRMPGLNEYTKACRGNKFGANSMKKKNEKAVQESAMEYHVNKIENYPIHMIIRWYEPNNRRDIDNVTFATKFILDGLVKMGVLVDDSRKYISSINHNVFTDKENPRIEVEIMEAE